MRQRMNHAVDVAAFDDFAHRPREVDVIDPQQPHDLAVAMRADGMVVRLMPLYETSAFVKDSVTCWLLSPAMNFGASSAWLSSRNGASTR